MHDRPYLLAVFWLLACACSVHTPPAAAQQREKPFYRAVRGADGKVIFVNSAGEVLRAPSASGDAPKELESLDALPVERRKEFDSTLARYQETLRRLEGAKLGTFAPEELVRLQELFRGYEERKNALASEYVEYANGLRSGPREKLLAFHRWASLYSEVVSAEFSREVLSSPLLQAVQSDNSLTVLRGLATLMRDPSKTSFSRMEQLRDLMPPDPEAVTAQQATVILAKWQVGNGDLARAEMEAVENRMDISELAREYIRSHQLSGISRALSDYEARNRSFEQNSIHKELAVLAEQLSSIAPGWGRLKREFPQERRQPELRGVER